MSKEKLVLEENNTYSRKQNLQDSFRNISATNNSNVEEVKSQVETKLIDPPKSEDLSSFVNHGVSTEVAVLMIDENMNILSSLSSAILSAYIKKGNRGCVSLLKSSFVRKTEFRELFEGNSTIIERLKLSDYTNYLAIGKISYSFQKGTLVEGTTICSTAITVHIISAKYKTIHKSFSFSVNGNGVNEIQAKEESIQKLINLYNIEYSSLQ
jgi:hypothetical protein